MNPRTTGILALVALALGAWVYFYEIGGEAERATASQAELRLFPRVAAADVNALEFKTLDGIDARFERSDGQWRLQSPVGAPADGPALEAIASMLADLARQGQVEKPGDRAQYGLADSARVVRFEVEGREESLVIGGSTPVGGHLYVSQGDETLGRGPVVSDVVYVESFRVNALSRNLRDLRDRRVARFTPDEVETIEIRWTGAALGLTRVESGWRLTEPIEDRADANVVRDLLTNLEYLEAAGFVDTETPETTAALDALTIEFVLHTQETTHTLRIGGEWAEGRIARGGKGRLFVIAPERVEEFDRELALYRDRTVVEIDVSQANRIDFNFIDDAGAAHVSTSRLGGAGWQSEGSGIEKARVGSLLSALAPLRAARIAADAMGSDELSGLGLTPPRARIRVYSELEAAEPLADLRLGRADSSGRVYAMHGDDSKVYLLAKESATELPIAWSAFQDGFMQDGSNEGELTETPPPAELILEDVEESDPVLDGRIAD